MTDQTAPWWTAATAYQIYPRSFQDSNGDGIGDIPGIISRLNHLSDLGVGFVWLSPVFASPMADNGYDISDYRDIAPEFGTLDDMDRLIAEAKGRNIGIVMDLVVNHTSDEHAWFHAACESRDNPMRDFYIWRDPGPDGGLPNDIQSNFGGPAWTFHEPTGQYYFHLFDPKQPDLNWENPRVRAEVYAMMNWWFDRGVAGFRMDVIDLIGKEPDRGITADGPKLHDYLQEMHQETLAHRDVVTVGECWSATPENALLYCGRDRNELSMVFQFSHVMAGWDETLGKWTRKPVALPVLKHSLARWQEVCAEDGWNSLFWGNHDLPRAVSKYGDDSPEHRVDSARCLATALHLMKGTPYIYQGEEIGMTNVVFERIDQFRDVETLNFHRIQTAQGLSTEDFLAGANLNGRDNARTPMQWSDAEHAGFTTGTPWIEVNPNYRQINVASDRASQDSVMARYKALATLRRNDDLIRIGDFVPFDLDHPQIMAYARRLGSQQITVICNLSSQSVTYDVPQDLRLSGVCAFTGRIIDVASQETLAPWEDIVVTG
ncbi:oligo-1,6-glucosidase [Loktanella sp. DSM 29012]|uniref:glycoside hydrolase family 13 protein n=1 Tax=Loktanella sp. DSM 29012 TaxID=1881056 RepID=UPI0008B234F2|nr:alpha-glucosidase [Loktanella sp. DSM 29012]SEQ22888.1 oligo-1,6-glucosidase [Loktanella sp. DSM 29012]